MIKSYQIAKLYSQTDTHELSKLVSYFSNNTTHPYIKDNQTVIFNFSVDKLNKDSISEFNRKFYISILSNIKFLALLRKFKDLNIVLKSAAFVVDNQEVDSETQSDLNIRIKEYINDECPSDIDKFMKSIDNECIKIHFVEFEKKDGLSGKISEGGVLYIEETDLEKYESDLLQIGNFIYTGEINE